MALAGIWGAAQYAQFTLETTWGVFDAAATVKPWVEIENGALALAVKPIRKTTMAATKNLRRRSRAGKYEVTGTFRTKMYPDLMVNLLPWACTPANVGSPARLTLPSYTIDWFDGLAARRYRGVRVEGLTIEADNDRDWPEATFTLRGKDVDTALPTMVEPAITMLPQFEPYVFQDMAGFVAVGGATLTGFKRVSLSYRNRLDPQFDEFPTLNSLGYCGRTVDWDVVLKRTSNTYRDAYEAQTALASGQVKWAVTLPGPVTKSVTFNLQNANYLDADDADINFDRDQYQTMRLQSFMDTTTGNDATLAVA